MKLLADKADPLEARRIERTEKAAAVATVITFAEAAKAYLDQNQAKWKNAKHGSQFLNTLKTYAYPHIGALAVSAISTGHVLKVLEQRVPAAAGYPAGSFWQTRTETASRVRGRIEAVLSWSTVRGYRTGDNPARWTGHLKEALPGRNEIAKVEHHAALPYAEIPQFMMELRAKEGSAARALEFSNLTAARTGEVIGAKWNEINLNKAIWIVPADRMKASHEHRVPLSDSAVKLLRDLPREDGNPLHSSAQDWTVYQARR